jgi:hypothetical protein
MYAEYSEMDVFWCHLNKKGVGCFWQSYTAQKHPTPFLPHIATMDWAVTEKLQIAA